LTAKVVKNRYITGHPCCTEVKEHRTEHH